MCVNSRPANRTLLCALILTSACTAPRPEARPSVGMALSVLPNVGFAAEGNLPVATIRSFDASVSVRITQQFLDDEDFADDGHAAAGDWTQAELGVLAQHAINERTRATLRLGLVWFRARREANIIGVPGDYFGAGAGIGFRTWITPNWSLGPEALIFFAEGEGELVKTPQIVWGLYWSPGK